MIIVDLVCRGANSPKVYKKYIQFLESKYKSKVTRVWFKNKTHGWKRPSTKIEFENRSCYLKDIYSDYYMIGFIRENLFMRPSCENCQFKKFPRVSDITLGDFWGVNLMDKNQDVEEGTSLVMVNSEKGRILFQSIKDRIFWEEKCIDDTLKHNPCIIKSVIMNQKRSDFFKKLDLIPAKDLFYEYCKLDYYKKIKCFIKKYLKE